MIHYDHICLGKPQQNAFDPHHDAHVSGHKPYRKYAKIICHLRDDVRCAEELPQSDVCMPDSACIHSLVKKTYDKYLDTLTWEEAVYTLITRINAEVSNNASDQGLIAFFQRAASQLKRATFGYHAWMY